MGFDLGGSINGFTDYIVNDTIFSSVIKNSFGTAVLIVLLIFIILSINYKNVMYGTKFYKTTFYIFLSVLGLLFMHYAAVKCQFENSGENSAKDELFNNIDKYRSETIEPVEKNENTTVDILNFNDDSIDQYIN